MHYYAGIVSSVSSPVTATPLIDPPTPSWRLPRASTWSLPQVRWAQIAIGLFIFGLTAQLSNTPPWVFWTLYLACYVSGGWEPGWAGLQALRRKTLDVDLLMVAAAIGAAAIGQVFDGALLIIIFATSGALEAVATKRTEDSVRGLLRAAPETATRLTDTGAEEIVDTSVLDIGDVLVIRPGERIGGDGVVMAGASEVNQASITGEPLPVDKTPGGEVFAGTVNGTGTLQVRVSAPAADTVIARIVAMVTEASASKAGMQLFIEKVEQRYSVGMVTATVALFVIPLMFGADLQSALLRAMTFMIVASPCALVLSTMPPLLAAIANASRHGVLIKSAVVLEKLATATHVAFDKTGTLTEGIPRLTRVHALPDANLSEAELLALAASAEHRSEHPIARAVVTSARQMNLILSPATDFASTPGRGIGARVGNHLVEVGRPTLLDNTDHHARPIVAELEHSRHTAVVVCVDGSPAGVLGIVDRSRSEAAETVAQLSRLTDSPPILLTGDNPRAATALAHEVAITDVRSALLPEDKVAAVRALQADAAKVMLVGDGLNDAPAMAAAHVGVAMGRSGAGLTLETSDAVIIRDDLSTVPAVLALARRARQVVAANLTVAATFIAVLVTWGLIGHLPLPLGVAGHEGSTLLVVLNGLRLLHSRAWATPTQTSDGSAGPALCRTPTITHDAEM
ncbi:heavy metal translocating P-type ATPase [Mycobacterium spongiae]|uniref:Heavy metal translocating P-type ATPase n=1 Tax=Mycobacterium spongiae TaxID=886343 RepID=A0A975PWC1_9MYCO|nr:heavy metal translocating P-type ATPase [Mycobacterium spongiae]QUR67000.1 heavy metal translocating P-type ATPase [Mycobacterium spongiae]